ncbi:MAG: dihydropteroate synthase [Gammaproteobacteria bacterium]|jgi:dihydropteroate synthase|nr:dihydropteroate synthase [Gammaproteobacteria bacterium]
MNLNFSNNKSQIMGILNVTPDSFYDGGKYIKLDNMMFRVDQMITEGMDIIDIGGESSRPGSVRISIQEEIDRLLPVVSKIRENYDIPISIDSTKPDVILKLLPYKINIINDISSISDERFVNIIKENNTHICLMHMLDNPETMQNNPNYTSVVGTVKSYLEDRVKFCVSHGISMDKIIIDPGFGFGKTLDHNYELLNNLKEFTAISQNILIGTSRKSMIGNLLNKNTSDRLNGSIASAVIAILNSAKIIRTHDVRQTKIAVHLAENIIRDEA